MAWTAPMTAVANATFTAAQFNTHVRDNLNETAPAKATAVNQFFVATAANAIAARRAENATVATTETTSSTSYTDLATSGPAVTATTGTAAVVVLTADVANSTVNAGGYMSVDVSGATTIAGNDIRALRLVSDVASNRNRASAMARVTVTAGSNTFTAKYKTTGSGTATFRDRDILVIPL